MITPRKLPGRRQPCLCTGLRRQPGCASIGESGSVLIRELVNMGISEVIPPRLAARRDERGVVVVEIAGDWLGRKFLPDIAPVDKELAVGGVSALEFEAKQLGRWDSALMARVLAIGDLCAQGNVEFRTKNLPDGLAKLIALAEAVPEKTGAAREDANKTFLQRVGESSRDAWNGGAAMLSFMGESVLALLNMLRGRAQFRWSDT